MPTAMRCWIQEPSISAFRLFHVCFLLDELGTRTDQISGKMRSYLAERVIRPAFSPISSNDLSGYVWITTLVGIVYAIMVAIVRMHIKLRVFGVDDYLLGLATVRRHLPSWAAPERIQLICSRCSTWCRQYLSLSPSATVLPT